jgi:hypothetical protein
MMSNGIELYWLLALACKQPNEYPKALVHFTRKCIPSESPVQVYP